MLNKRKLNTVIRSIDLENNRVELVHTWVVEEEDGTEFARRVEHEYINPAEDDDKMAALGQDCPDEVDYLNKLKTRIEARNV